MKYNKEIINMKKNILLLLMSFLFLTEAQAQDQGWSDEKSFCIDQKKFYVRFLSGLNFLQSTKTDGNKTTFKKGYIIDVSLGYCLPCGLRVEGEYALRRNGIKKIDFYIEDCSFGGRFQTSSGMANLIWDLPVSYWGCAVRNIQPYIGLGLGGDFQKMRSSNSRIIFCQKWKSLSWQVMAGLNFPIFCNTDMALEYKFHQGRCHLYNHSIGIGLIYKFGC